MHKGTILYVGGFELPDKNAAAHRVLSNAKIFRELGYNVVFCGVNREKVNTDNAVEDIEGFVSMPLPYPISDKQKISQAFSIDHYIKVFSKYSDIKLVVCYNLHSVSLAKLLRFCKKRNVKIVADCTEWYPNEISVNPISIIKSVNTFLRMQVYQKKCDGIIAISSYLAEYYKNTVSSIVVVPPLIDLQNEKYIFDGEKPVNDCTTLLFSGNPAVVKESLGDVVKSLGKLTDLNFKLKILGVDYKRFTEIYGNIPVCEKIEFFGSVSHEEALKKVWESDYALVVRPETRVTLAGFPTKFAEAISLGTPVIATNTSDLSEYLQDGKNGFIVDINNLENDFRKILSSNQKVTVQKDTFDYRLWIPKIQSFLDELMSD